MIKIEKRGFGYKINFGGILKQIDINQFKEELFKYILEKREDFSIYYDMRSIRYLSKDAQIELNNIRKELKLYGSLRSSVVFNRPGDEKQYEFIYFPVDNTERVLFASVEFNFEIEGINWLTREIDPNLKIVTRKKNALDNLLLKS